MRRQHSIIAIAWLALAICVGRGRDALAWKFGIPAVGDRPTSSSIAEPTSPIGGLRRDLSDGTGQLHALPYSELGRNTDLSMRGWNLSAKEAEVLEEKLRVNPENLADRTILMGYYEQRQFDSDDANRKLRGHVLWIVKNHPESQAAGQGLPYLRPEDSEGYVKAKNLWIEHIRANPNSVPILSHAANFFTVSDTELAIEYLKRTKTLDPKNPQWPESLAQLYGLGMNQQAGRMRKSSAEKALREQETAYKLSSGLTKWHLLPDLAEYAYESADLEKAKSYGDEARTKYAVEADAWKMMAKVDGLVGGPTRGTSPLVDMPTGGGAAIHHLDTILGRIALRKGDIVEAKRRLLQSGSPIGLPPPGPETVLARELLERGERDTVLKYFDLCEKWWVYGKDRLEDWRATVKAGGMPDFHAKPASLTN